VRVKYQVTHKSDICKMQLSSLIRCQLKNILNSYVVFVFKNVMSYCLGPELLIIVTALVSINSVFVKIQSIY
jgi:hypothetical protein